MELHSNYTADSRDGDLESNPMPSRLKVDAICQLQDKLRLCVLLRVLQDAIQLHGEVSFPNLHFEKTVIDFGCILNDTEATRYLNITNTSPLDVSYHWSFVIDNKPVAEFRKLPFQLSSREESTMKVEDLDVDVEGRQNELWDQVIESQVEVGVDVEEENLESPGLNESRIPSSHTQVRLKIIY